MTKERDKLLIDRELVKAERRIVERGRSKETWIKCVNKSYVPNNLLIICFFFTMRTVRAHASCAFEFFFKNFCKFRKYFLIANPLDGKHLRIGTMSGAVFTLKYK